MLTHVCVLLFIFGLTYAQEGSTSQTTNKISDDAANINQKSIAAQPQFNPLTYQNTQLGTNPNLIPNPQIFPQTQFNPLAFQNPQLGNPPQQFLHPFANQGLFNPQLGNPLNNGGFPGFNPQLLPNENQQNLLQPSIKEIRIPQPYPVFISKPVPVQVPVRVPVEVPKPYAVRVPHPVPVPVQVKVPVPVEKPYPVQITRTVPVPVEKPVYIRVPFVVPQEVAQQYHSQQPQNFLQGYQQQLLNFGEVGNPGPIPQEVQIGGRVQANGGVHSLGAPLRSLPRDDNPNLQSDASGSVSNGSSLKLKESGEPNGAGKRQTR